jgi:hypothetical protein
VGIIIRRGTIVAAVVLSSSLAGCSTDPMWAPAGEASERTIAIVDGGMTPSLGRTDAAHTWIAPNLPGESPDGHADLLAAAVLAEFGDGTPSFLDVRVATPNHPATPDSIAQGVEWAVGSGADVVLIALSSRFDSAALRAALRNADRNDVLVVSSMRNELIGARSFPADHESVLSVSSVDQSGARASTSPRDGDVSALGVDVDLGPGGEVSGTSIAAASAVSAVIRCAGWPVSRDDLLRDAQRRGVKDDRGVPVLRCTERKNQ